MFIRWKRRPTRANQMWRDWQRLQGDMLLSAYLVESVRIEGKPRQKQHFLASIHLSGATGDYGGMPSLTESGSMYERDQFWATIETILPRLQLDTTQIQRIREKLAETVPLLTAEEQTRVRTSGHITHPLKPRRSATI